MKTVFPRNCMHEGTSGASGVRWPMGRSTALHSLLSVALLGATGVSLSANRESEALRRRAAAEFYNLDRDRAVDLYREAVAADPQDAGAYRGLASALWLSITFRRGNMTVDDYIGGVNRRPVATVPPPPAIAAQFQETLERALGLARREIAADPRNVE